MNAGVAVTEICTGPSSNVTGRFMLTVFTPVSEPLNWRASTQPPLGGRLEIAAAIAASASVAPGGTTWYEFDTVVSSQHRVSARAGSQPTRSWGILGVYAIDL